jgi:hypothetical protein
MTARESARDGPPTDDEYTLLNLSAESQLRSVHASPAVYTMQ